MASNDINTERVIYSLNNLYEAMEAKMDGILHDVSLTKKTLLEDSKKKNEWLQDISEEVGTIEERTTRLEKKMSGIEESVDDMQFELHRMNMNLTELRKFCERAFDKPTKKRKRVD